VSKKRDSGESNTKRSRSSPGRKPSKKSSNRGKRRVD
jgi:hypothetical protein